MENNEKQSTESKAGLNKVEPTVNSLTTINNMEDFERLVNFVYSSEIYNKPFTINSEVDGKPVRIVDKNAISTCLMLGSELGFKPIESIMLGRRLNDEAVIKVYRGKDLGLSPMAAMQNIYVWKNESGAELVYTGIHVIYKALTDAGVTKRVIDDGTKPYYEYTSLDTKEIVDYDTRYHILTNGGLPIRDIEAGLQAKKIPVSRKSNYRGLVELTRKRTGEVIAIPYTIQQAIDAGLYGGTNSSGEEVKGKNNWNKHPAAHLIKMSVMAGARMIIGDRLQGSIYIAEELPIVEKAGKYTGIVEDSQADVVD